MMKKLFLYPILFGIFLLNIAGTCCDDELEVVVVAKNDLIQLKAIISEGTWKMTYFLNKKSNKVTEYSAYNFAFGTNEILTSDNGSNTFTGNWSAVKSNSIDDNPENDLDFVISFSNPEILMELSKHWDVTEISKTKVRLKSKSDIVDGITYLTFEKN
jgi:hypothetical protein